MNPLLLLSRSCIFTKAFGASKLRSLSKKFSTSAEFDHVQYSIIANDIIKNYCSDSSRCTTLILARNKNYSALTSIERIPGIKTTIVHAVDNVADTYDCQVLCKLLADSDMQSFMVSPGERKLTGDTSVLEYLLPENTLGILDYLKNKVKRVVESTYKQSVHESGCIISWLSPPYAINNSNTSHDVNGVKRPQQALSVDVIAPDEGTYSYWSAHCDKANNNDYDISVLLYLNNDFTGGDLIFMDRDGRDSVVQPVRGRLVMFNSCVDNIHRVQAVTQGDRFLLSIWYRVKKRL